MCFLLLYYFRFVINFRTWHGDIILHFNPRIDQNCVVRNSLVGGKWSGEERNGGLPFQRGGSFDVSVKIEQAVYRVIINGREFCQYHHHSGFENLKSYEVTGDIQVVWVKESPGFIPYQPQNQPGYNQGLPPCPPGQWYPQGNQPGYNQGQGGYQV